MSTTLTPSLKMVLSHIFSTIINLGTPTDNFRLDLSQTLANGNAINQADQVFYDQRTLAATSESLVLYGSLTNPFLQTVNFATIRGLVIENNNVTPGANLIVGGAGTHPWYAWCDAATDKVTVGPGGILLLWNPSAAGYAVVSGASDQLKIDAGAATITYDIYILGTT